MQQHAFVATKTPAGKLFPTFLRFAAAPSGHWRSLSTSTHKANNVVNGSTLVQHRSVEHYEAVDVSRFIDQFLFRAAKVGKKNGNKHKSHGKNRNYTENEDKSRAGA